MIAAACKIALVIGVWATIAWGVNRLSGLDASLNLELPVWAEVPGAIAILIGAAGVLWCGVMLSRVGIFSMPGRDRLLPGEFLATGPFRFTRNPMSLAGVTLFVGLALWNRSTLALGLAVVVLIVFHVFVVRVEEPGLERRFGESYLAYKRQVPRWLPGSTRRRR